VGLQASYLL